MLQALRGAVLVHHAAAEGLLDRGLGRPGKRLASRPREGGRDAQPSRALLRGEDRQHRRVAREERGLEGVELGDELGQGSEHRVGARLESRMDAAQVLPGGHAREMISRGDHERGAPAPRDEARGVEGYSVELRAHEGVVGGHGVLVLQEDAGNARAAGALPHVVAAEERGADAMAIGEETLDVVAAHAPIGAPVVEAVHELRLGDDGQARERHPAGGQARVVAAIERRSLAGEGHERSQAMARDVLRRDAAVPRPPELGEIRAVFPEAEGILDSIEGGRGRRRRGRESLHRETIVPLPPRALTGIKGDGARGGRMGHRLPFSRGRLRPRLLRQGRQPDFGVLRQG